jgi:hypothetical protein
MNTPKALSREYGLTDKLDENKRQELAPKAESSPSTEHPHRASTMSSTWTDMLARVEGVARWGLNE